MVLRLKEPFQYLKKYLTNPLFTIRIVPDWNFAEIFAFQLGISLALGFLSALLSNIYINIFIFPFSSITITFVGSLFFYSLFSLLFQKEFSFLKIYMIVFLSHLPFLFLRIIKFWVAPIELIGFAATVILLTVGFVENFELPKRKLIIVSGSMYLIYFLVWIGGHLYTQKITLDIKSRLKADDIQNENSIERIKQELAE